MNIIEQIQDKISCFIQEYNKQPRFIIIGENKIFELSLFFDNSGQFVTAAGCNVVVLKGDKFKDFLEIGC